MLELTEGNQNRLCFTALAIALAIWLILDVFSALTASPSDLVCRLEDDAFFYATISRNAVDDGIISFDGVSETNGFHPLWMGMCIVTRSFIPDQIGFLRAVSILSALLLFCAGFVAVKMLSRNYSSLVTTLTFILLLRYLRDFAHLGMETSVLLPLAFIALILLDRITSASSKRSLLLLGCTLALIGLARLDAALLALLIGILAVKQYGVGRTSILPLFLPGAIAGTAYLVVNKLFFGSWVSVSGSIKASGAGFNFLFSRQLFLLSDPLGLRSPWGLFLVFFILSLMLLFIKQKKPSIKIVSAFLLLFTISQLLLSSWHMWYWYAYPAVLFSAFCFPFLLQKLLLLIKVPKFIQSISSIVLVALALFLSVFWGMSYPAGKPDDFRTRNMLIAEELNEIMEDTTLVAMGDRAGSFAYFFRGGVVQMEGLAGSVELAESIKQGILQDYLIEHKVDFIVSWTGPENTVDYSSWDLLVPDEAQSLSPPNTITVQEIDELRRWYGSTGTVFLWEFNGSNVVR